MTNSQGVPSASPSAVGLEESEMKKMEPLATVVSVATQSAVVTHKNFNALSMLSLAVSLMATWEAFLSTMGLGLTAGGPVALLYGFIAAFIGNIATAMSLSEQASMYPTAGGQYHFLVHLSSASCKGVFGWYSGWLTLLGWAALTASAPYASANLIQGLTTLNHPEYVPQRWHATLIYFAILAISFSLNFWGSRALPLLENLIMTLHVLFFFAIFIAVVVLPPTRNSASFVFTTFINSSGWQNDGVAWCLGMLTSSYIMIGYDSATHMSEEIQNPQIAVPRAMIGSLILNGGMGFALLIAVLFGMGDVQTALATPTGFPIIAIFQQMTRDNLAATTAMVCTVIISASLATVGLTASTSRTLWAFARDDAPPFSRWLSRLDRKRHIPSNAVICTTVFLAILGLLNIASTTAFNAVLSLTVVSLCLSYLLPIVAMLYRRLRTPTTLTYGPWRLPAVLGLITNIVAICYNVFVCIFLLLPPTQPVTATNMNYAGVVLGGVLVLVSADWLLRGRRVYLGPAVN